MPSTSRARRLYVVTVLFLLLVGDGVRYTIGWWGFSALALVLAAIAIVLLVRRRRSRSHAQRRRRRPKGQSTNLGRV